MELLGLQMDANDAYSWRGIDRWRQSRAFEALMRVDDVDLLCRSLRSSRFFYPNYIDFDHDDAKGMTDQDLEFLFGSILRTSHGDVNLDGRFDSTGLVSFS
ncbi:MAG: hypothetical protein R3C28_04205 [Pirellulaceae bacterium]